MESCNNLWKVSVIFKAFASMIHSSERLCGHAKATAFGLGYLARRGAFQAGSSV